MFLIQLIIVIVIISIIVVACSFYVRYNQDVKKGSYMKKYYLYRKEGNRKEYNSVIASDLIDSNLSSARLFLGILITTQNENIETLEDYVKLGRINDALNRYCIRLGEDKINNLLGNLYLGHAISSYHLAYMTEKYKQGSHFDKSLIFIDLNEEDYITALKGIIKVEAYLPKEQLQTMLEEQIINEK